ncbi:MAG TPA: hypothetical protein VGC09_15155 [Rhodopila sp.]
MKKTLLAVGLGLLLMVSPLMTCSVLADEAAGNARSSTVGGTRPHIGNGPAEEKSLPSSAPPATTTRTTGATDQDKTVRTMNSNERAKVEVGGK